ncbi:MAG: serine/threonine protein kinase [Nannocystaceae bacterium]|nr:serine/threonine protein kinase [bacterium]
MEELGPGTKLGRYVIEERVGQGSGGRVFYARQLNVAAENGMPCVIKVAKDLDHQGRRHFLDEARIAIKLGPCANIVRVFDADEVDGTPFFVMEYADGIDLRRLLSHQQKNERRPLPLPVIYTVLKGMADGLHYAHARRKIGGKPLGLIHRDIKPANTLITTDGETKLLDFGISTRVDADHSGRHLFGTFRYMSPEHVQGNVCPAMDLYSLGVVAWEMLEGRAFRKGLTQEQLLPLILTEGNTPPLERTDLPEELRDLVERTLSFDPSERPTAEEFAEALSACPGYVFKPKLVADRVQLALGRMPRSRETEHFEIPEELRTSTASQPTLLRGDDAPTLPRHAPAQTTDDPPTRRWSPNDSEEEDAPVVRRRHPLAKPIVIAPELAPTERLTEQRIFAQRTQPSPSASASSAPHRAATEQMEAPVETSMSAPIARRTGLPAWTRVLIGVALSCIAAGGVAWWLITGSAQ